MMKMLIILLVLQNSWDKHSAYITSTAKLRKTCLETTNINIQHSCNDVVDDNSLQRVEQSHNYVVNNDILPKVAYVRLNIK